MPAQTVRLIRRPVHGDARGWFTESWSRPDFTALGIGNDFIQDNHSRSAMAGTVRGLHFQAPPHAQAKLVRCVRGRIFDVAVDIRRGSPSFGHHVSRELTADNHEQLFVPAGFAHGFMTLEPDCEVLYKIDAPYAPDAEDAVRWNDPALGIAWPELAPTLSAKDAAARLLAALDTPFAYDGAPLEPLA